MAGRLLLEKLNWWRHFACCFAPIADVVGAVYDHEVACRFASKFSPILSVVSFLLLSYLLLLLLLLLLHQQLGQSSLQLILADLPIF